MPHGKHMVYWQEQRNSQPPVVMFTNCFTLHRLLRAPPERLQALGAKVVYPGLQSHPQHALLQRLANPGYGLGGMLTVELPNMERAKLFLERLQNKHGFGLMAVSLGYFDTLMSASAASTSSELSDAELARAGISGGLVRFSVGLTGSQAQRWEQLEESYRHVAGVPLGVKPAFKAVQVCTLNTLIMATSCGL
jgi:methionine-gamma-lyase